MVCLDSSTIIDFLRGHGPSVKLIGSYEARNEVLTTTVVSVYELLRSPSKRSREEAEAFLSKLFIYPLTEAAARRSAEMCLALKSKGVTIDDPDIMVASIAASNGELLVASDKDFENTGYDRLKIIEK